ncbi:MAG: type II secretion system ATPase GspE [Pseudomonadota bacterium]
MIENFLDVLSKDITLTSENKDRVRAVCARDKSRFMEMVCDTRLVSEIQALKALGVLYGLFVMEELGMESLKNDFTHHVSRKFLKTYCMVPLINDSREGMIAINDPSDLSAVDDLLKLTGLKKAYSLVLAPKNQILLIINMLYDHADGNVQQLVDDMEEDDSLVIEDIEQTADLLDDSSDAPVIRLVNQMISQAVKAGASDVHIEPFQEILKVRYRIDGIMYDLMTPPKMFQSALVSRIKVMAKMNIAEKRVPQDGRAQVRLGNQEIDLRISTVPTTYGERLVMRLLNKSGSFMSILEFGLSKENEALFHQIIRQNHGIVLVTGPTGSGKTTTLYAGLSEINTPDKTIITIEDPVEYNLEGIGQIQVNQKTGVTFAKGLRSIVRQDPDIILIGEIRDVETAEIAIQSALTGHLVFSTLHTNDAAGAVTRLVDLGVEPYLISSSVNHVIAQRLVRVLCQHCKEKYILCESDIQSIASMGDVFAGQQVFKPKGCSRCFDTGYSGRQAIVEILTLDDAMKSLILQTSDSNRIRDAALAKGMITLRRDGMKKVMAGITSIREVLRVTQE